MRVLICGGRDWQSIEPMRAFIALLPPGTTIIEGEARGADSMARELARERKLTVERYPADWATYGRAAGPIRNKQMLDAEPDLVVAFHPNLSESKGTANMVSLARKKGVPVIVVCE